MHHAKDQVHQQQKDGDAQDAVGDHLVNAVRERQTVGPGVSDHLPRQPTDKAIATVGDGNVHVVAIDGLQVCDHLRFDPETRDVPVIFLTAKQDPTVKSTASILDAYAYIEKPFAPDAMLAEIRNCLNVFGRNDIDDDRQHASP